MEDKPKKDRPQYLTIEEVFERYRGRIQLGTLRNWRAARIGPSFIKPGKTILYPAALLDAWDKQNLIKCDAMLEEPGDE